MREKQPRKKRRGRFRQTVLAGCFGCLVAASASKAISLSPFFPLPPCMVLFYLVRGKRTRNPQRKFGRLVFLLFFCYRTKIEDWGKKLKVLHFENEEGNLLKVFVTSVWEVVIPSKEPVRRRESSYDVDSAGRRGEGKAAEAISVPTPPSREIWAPRLACLYAALSRFAVY